MTAVTRPRGPLPRRVYWVRRLLVLGVAFALVFGIAQLLGGSAGDPGPDSATPVVATPTGTTSVDATPSASAEKPGTRKEGKAAKRERDLPAKPTGPCAEDDVLVNPSVLGAHAGRPIEIVLEVSTVEADACTWEVSPESVFLTVASEVGVIWSSQDCRSSIPVEAVVPRREKAALVTVLWNGMESDEECTDTTDWVEEGLYSASAVARGSVTPLESEFVVSGAVASTVTTTPTPTPEKKDKKDRKNR